MPRPVKYQHIIKKTTNHNKISFVKTSGHDCLLSINDAKFNKNIKLSTVILASKRRIKPLHAIPE